MGGITNPRIASLFERILWVFLKGICTLAVRADAVVVVACGAGTVREEARVGLGLVALAGQTGAVRGAEDAQRTAGAGNERAVVVAVRALVAGQTAAVPDEAVAARAGRADERGVARDAVRGALLAVRARVVVVVAGRARAVRCEEAREHLVLLPPALDARRGTRAQCAGGERAGDRRAVRSQVRRSRRKLPNEAGAGRRKPIASLAGEAVRRGGHARRARCRTC